MHAGEGANLASRESVCGPMIWEGHDEDVVAQAGYCGI